MIQSDLSDNMTGKGCTVLTNIKYAFAVCHHAIQLGEIGIGANAINNVKFRGVSRNCSDLIIIDINGSDHILIRYVDDSLNDNYTLWCFEFCFAQSPIHKTSLQ